MTLKLNKSELAALRKETPQKRKNVQHEASEQESLFDWIRLKEKRFPEYQFIAAIPNGGKRNKIEAECMRRQGVRAGILDICWLLKRGFHSGLWIELKHGKNKLTDEQVKWREFLIQQGFIVFVCYSAIDAQAMIENYYNGKYLPMSK